MLRKCWLSLFLLSLALTFLAMSSFGQTFSGTATAATSTHAGGQTYGNLDLSGGPQTFIDLHWGYLDHTECGVNGASPCTFVSDPSLSYNAGYNQAGGASGCLGVCLFPGVPRDTYEGEGINGTNDVQLDSLGMPTLGTPIGIQTSVSHDSSSSTSSCALGYFATPFGPYNGIVNASIGQTGPVDAMYQALDIRSTATASCTPSGGSVSFTFHHDYDKLGLVLPINPGTPQYFMNPVCYDLNSGLPPFNFIPLPTTTPTPGSICFNQVLDQSTTPTGASITVAAAVLTDTDNSTLYVCKTHADAESCGTPPPPSPMLACQSQGSGVVGSPYSSSLMASGGTPPYVTYSILTGSLPNGLVLNPNTGDINGTPTAPGQFNFTAQVTDSAGQTGQTPASPTCNIVVTTPPQLQVVKTPKGGSFSMGGQASFTIVVSNTGGNTATNVMLNDQLPGNGGLVWTAAMATVGSCVNPIAGNNLSCSLGNIASGGSVTVVVSSAASTPVSACQSQPNPAAIATSDNTPPAQDSGSLNCTPTGKTFSIGPSSMEGHIILTAGDWVSGGFSFTYPGSHPQVTETIISATVSVPVTCPQGGGSGGTIVIPLGMCTNNGVCTASSLSYTVPANNSNWYPTGDQNSVLSWQGAVKAPDFCGGKPMDNSKGAIFTATVTKSPAISQLANFRFKYRDPNAKGKGNVNCTDQTNPKRNDAATCGASWSQTVIDP